MARKRTGETARLESQTTRHSAAISGYLQAHTWWLEDAQNRGITDANSGILCDATAAWREYGLAETKRRRLWPKVWGDRPYIEKQWKERYQVGYHLVVSEQEGGDA